jgi:hypothetical protein
MTQSAERRVTTLSIAALSELGVEVSPVDDPEYGDVYLLGPDAERYFLHTLVETCQTLPDDEWAGYIAFHFRQHFEGMRAPAAAELTEPALLTQVRTRLQPDAVIDPALTTTYARPFADNLVVHLCRDLPTTVETLTDQTVESRDLDLLYQAGQRNTDAEPFESEEIPVTGTNAITTLQGESFFIASKALNMKKVVDTVLGDAAHGVVFSVPHRHLLMLHPVTNLQSTVAVRDMVGYTLGQADEAPGGNISPHTFFWYGGRVQQITRIDPVEKSIMIESRGMFGEALSRFA